MLYINSRGAVFLFLSFSSFFFRYLSAFFLSLEGEEEKEEEREIKERKRRKQGRRNINFHVLLQITTFGMKCYFFSLSFSLLLSFSFILSPLLSQPERNREKKARESKNKRNAQNVTHYDYDDTNHKQVDS